jgi:hypothetical protein
MVSIEDERLPRRKQPAVAPLTAPTGGNSHHFKRVEGRTYSVCTVCGVLMRTPAENDAARCIPKTQPIREDDPKLSVRVKPFGK